MSRTILHHYVEIGDNSGIIKPDNRFTVTELLVLGENDRYMVVNNETFTTLDKQATKYSIGSPFNKAAIHASHNDSCWGNRITYSLYSDSRKRASTIRREIEREMEKRYGFFVRGLDLSVVSDEAPRAAIAKALGETA